MHADLPIRVAVDLSSLRPGGENGGIKPFLFETLLWLTRQERVALHLVFLTNSLTHAEVREELARVGDEVVCVRDHGGVLPRGNELAPRERVFLPAPVNLLEQLDANVLYCPFGQPEFAYPGVATVCTVVDVLHRDFPWSLDAAHNAEREKAFQQIAILADALQCNSHYVISRMREHFDVPPERMFTVYNAVHRRFAASHFHSGPERKKTSPFFFYPANAWRHKNHETLLVAYGIYRASALAAGVNVWPLVLTGHEDARWEEMRGLAGTLDLLGEGGVDFRGYVSGRDFATIWETAGALVFPSLHEGFGIPLLEAMEHDVPVLCSGDCSLPEVGADACLYVDARNPEKLAGAMTRLAGDEALRARLVEMGRRRLRDFSLDHEAGKLLDAFVKLAGAAPEYRPFSRGIHRDGWTDSAAFLAVPRVEGRSRLTLRFEAMPAERRLRLRLGKAVLGSFHLPPYLVDNEVRVTLRDADAVLNLEIPNAANVDAADGRCHGVRLASIALEVEGGRKVSLFNAE